MEYFKFFLIGLGIICFIAVIPTFILCIALLVTLTILLGASIDMAYNTFIKNK